MKVSFNPTVSFRSNLIEEAIKKNGQQPQVPPQTQQVQQPPKVVTIDMGSEPVDWGKEWNKERKDINVDISDILESKKIPEGLKAAMTDKNWQADYNGSTVHLKFRNSYDGLEYDVYPDGKVVKDSGWSNPETVMEPNKEMSIYYKRVKREHIKRLLIPGQKETEDILAKLDAEEKNDNMQLKSKKDIFNEALNSRKWEKEYLPESDIIVLKNKKIKDSAEYMMEKDGTVKKIGSNTEPEVIIEPSIEGAKEFGKLKIKLTGEDDNTQKSLWYKMKSAVASIWKFFKVTGTMTVATTKGLAEGVAVGAGVLASAMILRGGYKAIAKNIPLKELAKNPFKTAGKAGILISAAAGCAVLAAEVIAGRMKANQQSAVIEHKLDVAHDLT